MTNTAKLKGRIVEKGYNMTNFAKAINRSRPCLRSRINGQSDFKTSEIEKVCALLDIPESQVGLYFFAPDVPKMETITADA